MTGMKCRNAAGGYVRHERKDGAGEGMRRTIALVPKKDEEVGLSNILLIKLTKEWTEVNIIDEKGVSTHEAVEKDPGRNCRLIENEGKDNHSCQCGSVN